MVEQQLTRLLTVFEVAGRLHVHPCTVRRWISKGVLPAVRLGKRMVRVKEADLVSFVAGTRHVLCNKL